MQRSLTQTAVLVLAYYLLTLGSLLFVMYEYPEAREFIPIGGLHDEFVRDPSFADESRVTPPGLPAPEDVPWLAFALLNSLVGTLIFVAPVAWVYARTRSGKMADSVVETLFLLPVVVATVVIIVQDSVALAFSLFGIVSAVRFRNNLKDPADAVFVFAALGVGLSAGVSEIGVAGMGSMVFCLTVLTIRIFRSRRD